MEMQPTKNPINYASLQGLFSGRVRELAGYTKPKAPLSTHNDWERTFVEEAGASDVERVATEVFDQLREAFRYKRKELLFTNAGSTASIQCPDFDVHIVLVQDPDDAERYRLTTDVREFRNVEILNDPRFLSIFTKYCSRVVLELQTPLDVEKTIDDIEEIDSISQPLIYDPECTYFVLRLGNVAMHATANVMTFELQEKGELKSLLANTQALMAQLSRNQVTANLFDASGSRT
jgi:hypothetical protein